MAIDFFKGIEKDNSPWFNYSWEPSFASFGIYTRPLAYPQAIHYKGCYDRTYIVYQDKNFNSLIIFFDHELKSWSDPQIIGTTTIGKNDHGAPSIAIDHGYIFVFYGAHNSPIKVKKTSDPEIIFSWESLPDAGTGSYPQPYIKSDGEIHLFYRGVEKTGDKTRPYVRRISRDHGQTWSDEEIIIEFKNWGVYSNVYWASDNDVSISWFKWDIFCSNSIDSRFDVYYVKSDDGGKTWKKADNSLVALPINELTADTVFKSYPHQAYVWDLQVSQNGIPFILFTTGAGSKAKYMVAYWDKQSWEIHEIMSTNWIRNPGVIDIRESNCIEAYLIKGNYPERGGELQKYSSIDNGASWKYSGSLMSESNYMAWAMQIVKNYDTDLKIIWSIGNMDPGHIVYEGEAPERIKISKICPITKQDPSETIEFYKKMPVHPTGIPKNGILPQAKITMTDVELVSFYSERYAGVDVAEFSKNERKDLLFGLCNMVKPEEYYLNIGCADGGDMDVLYQRGIHGVGLDLAVTNILRGREKYPHLKFIHGFAEEIPFSDNYFDIVILGNDIEHFRNPQLILTECLRVARTGLVICVPIKEEKMEKHINPDKVDRILSLLDLFKLTKTFFNPQGEIIPKEGAVSVLKEFPWHLIRAEKTEDSDMAIKKYQQIHSTEIENRGKTELLDKDQWRQGNFHTRDPSEIARFNLVSHLIEGNRVLEIGAGNGDSTIALSKTGCKVVGIDISETGIRDAFQFSRTQDLSNIPEFDIMDATELAFLDNTFDTVVIPEVIEHVKSSRKIFQEAIRVVRNGGRIIFSVPDGLLVPWSGHLRVFFKDTLTTELSQYSDTISWHDLPFKKWIVGSFFVKKDHLALNQGPVVDILMPSYNGRATIERAIRSVVNQTYENWNLIVINDGGEDLGDIIKKFDDPRIKYISSEHKGKSHALNTGLQNSEGKYVSYLDDDDILYPIHIEELVNGIYREGAEFVWTDWYEVSYDNKNTEFMREVEFREDVTPDMLITKNYINHKCILHSRRLLNETGGYDEELSVLIDWDMIRRLAFKANPVHIRSFTSERIRYFDNNMRLTNRITGLWTRDKNKVTESIKRIFDKTDDLNASVDDLTRAVKRAMLTISYYNFFVVQELNLHLQTFQQEVNAKQQEVNAKQQEVNAKDRQLVEITGQLHELSQAIAEKDQQLQGQTTRILSLEQKIFSIEKSIIWQFVMKFHIKIIERVFPQNTRRRSLFDLGLNGSRILINDGPRTFLKKSHEFIISLKSRNTFVNKPDKSDQKFSKEKLKSMNHELNAFSYTPKISIICPVYNVDKVWLNRCVKSVLSQIYQNWELCLVDDGSTFGYIKESLHNYSQIDARIKVKMNETNKGISCATNDAINLASGEFLTFLDNDDELTKDALFEVVKVLNQEKNLDVIYSDEDKLSENGKFVEPFFKPDWSPEYFRGVMYVGHLLTVRKSLAEEIGYFDKTFDSVQDYEFMLRLSEKTDRIYHIPKILYHWRKIQGSIASNTNSKGDISDKQVAAVNAHLKRVRLPALALTSPLPHRVIINPLQRSEYPLVSIIIPTKDKPELIGRCLKSIFGITKYPNFEVIIIDNNTTDQTAKNIINSYPCKKIYFPETFNFSKVNNLGAKNSSGEYLIFLNNDTEIQSDNWIHHLLYYSEQQDVAAAGPLLSFPDNTVQHAGVVLGFRGSADHIMRDYPVDCDGYAGSLSCAREVSAITAACMMVKKSIFCEVGGFNEHYSIIYQDVDLCLKFITRGYRIIFDPRVIITHFECSTRDKYQYDLVDRYLFLDQWSDLIDKGDKYYNCNFDLTKYGKNNTGYLVKQNEVT